MSQIDESIAAYWDMMKYPGFHDVAMRGSIAPVILLHDTLGQFFGNNPLVPQLANASGCGATCPSGAQGAFLLAKAINPEIMKRECGSAFGNALRVIPNYGKVAVWDRPEWRRIWDAHQPIFTQVHGKNRWDECFVSEWVACINAVPNQFVDVRNWINRCLLTVGGW